MISPVKAAPEIISSDRRSSSTMADKATEDAVPISSLSGTERPLLPHAAQASAMRSNAGVKAPMPFSPTLHDTVDLRQGAHAFHSLCTG